MGLENPKVNIFFTQLKKWREELEILRSIILQSRVEETLKWNAPCYMVDDKNVIIIQGFKDYFAIMFFKGSLLKDPNNILSQPGTVQAGRQIRFKNLDELLDAEVVLRAYIDEAIEIEKSGAKVAMKKPEDVAMPEELKDRLAQDNVLQQAFFQLTPGRQKAYNLYIAEAKQSKTRIDRIEKNISRILKGKGLNDCICGLSQRMPNCDGSHKFAKNL